MSFVLFGRNLSPKTYESPSLPQNDSAYTFNFLCFPFSLFKLQMILAWEKQMKLTPSQINIPYRQMTTIHVSSAYVVLRQVSPTNFGWTHFDCPKYLLAFRGHIWWNKLDDTKYNGQISIEILASQTEYLFSYTHVMHQTKHFLIHRVNE